MKRTTLWGFELGTMLIIALWLVMLPFGLYRLYATDEVQYFSYLHSLYFDRDLNFENEYRYFADIGQQRGDSAVYDALLRDHPTDPPINPETGLYRNVAPIGSAVLWSPAYILADGFVNLGLIHGPADGLSKPYIVAVCLASAFYTLLGLILSYRLARRWASQWAATIATLTVWLASPLVFYTYVQMPWSHGASFALVALFLTIWLSPPNEAGLAERARDRSLGHWVALGIVGGLMTLTREQLGLFLLLPAVESLIAYWYLMREGAWKSVGKLVAKHSAFLSMVVLMLVPQLLVYQTLYGQPRPSGTVSGKLNLVSYHFFDTLFDRERGAFLWSPILLIGLLGYIWLWRKRPAIAGLLLLGFIAQTYINGAFGSTWHLRGSFGFRRLIECTPIFIIGLAMLIQEIRLPRWAIGGIAALFIAWNGGLIVQATVTNPIIKREGLVWSTMLHNQIEAPIQAWNKLDQLLFNRCELMVNCEE